MAKPRLLLINKFYHDVGPAGGVGRYLVQEEEDLLAAGWDVIPFAMADEHARPSPWDRFFVQAHDYSKPQFGSGTIGSALSLVWNREAARNLDALIREARPDVAHLHNIYHHLSPSILPVLARHGIPVVMTLHDLRLLCPAIHMLRLDGVCERCKGGQLHNAVLGKCVKGSRAASLLAAVETFHQRSRGLYENTVRRFLCPSDFYRRKYAEWGYPEHKLQHFANFVDLDFWHPDRLDRQGPGDSILYFGRISREKGLRTLLDAQHLWETKHAAGEIADPPLPLRIAGTGPCDGNLKAHIATLGLKSVEVLGALDIVGLRQALSRARFSVLTSEWYENGPMAALESLASGVPLAGTDIGGIPEMIVDGETGVIMPAGDAEGVMRGLMRAADLPAGTRQKSRVWAENNASRSMHMQKLIKTLAGISKSG